jgi:hypothetical protein
MGLNLIVLLVVCGLTSGGAWLLASMNGHEHAGWPVFMGVWGLFGLSLGLDLLKCERLARMDGESHRRGGHLLAIAIIVAVMLLACLIRALR